MNKPLFCWPKYGHCDIVNVLDGEGWCRKHEQYTPRNKKELLAIVKRRAKYKVVNKYLAGDEKYIGRECIIYEPLGQNQFTVLFTDVLPEKFEVQSFPIECLKKQKRGKS